MGLNDIIKIFAEGLGVSLVGVCGVGMLFVLVIAFGCSLFGGDEGAEKKDDDSDDDDRTMFD
jgi:hypothetical protein